MSLLGPARLLLLQEEELTSPLQGSSEVHLPLCSPQQVPPDQLLEGLGDTGAAKRQDEGKVLFVIIPGPQCEELRREAPGPGTAWGNGEAR